MSDSAPGPRRASHVSMPVAYAAIGASASPDLMRFPPEGSTPFEEELQLGSGSERFLASANLLMTWGAQRAAGYDIVDIVRGETEPYPGVNFTDAGVPEAAPDPEELFNLEGEPYILPGTQVTLVTPTARRRILVVSTINEPRRQGFMWGDCDEEPGYGEQLLVVEHRADGTVWAIARGFAYLQASGLLAGRKQKAELRDVVERAQNYLAGLAPGMALRSGVITPDSIPVVSTPELEASETEVLEIEVPMAHARAEEASTEDVQISEPGTGDGSFEASDGDDAANTADGDDAIDAPEAK